MATKTPLAEYSGTFRVMESGDTIPAAIVPILNQNTTGSAAKLTTARTINGTSFNGTANITTANWGTARTLTIGNTGKSVNGSANYSWTLDEIGAASNDALSNNWPDTGGMPGCTDANSPPATWCTFGNTATNTPYAGYGTLWTFNTSGTGKTLTPASGVWLRQFAFATNGFFYSRVNINASGWTGWIGPFVEGTNNDIQRIAKLTAAAYAALGTKDPNTLYVIVG